MDTELHRAMSSLGNTATDATQQPKPYFLSYAVSDSDSVSLTAQFGAITGSHESRRRTADVQVRLGTPAEDNTHGDHRNSALTTVPLPLTNDREALARSLWFATNRGYGKALDGYLKVKTEQQVRAKEEDSSADFSSEKPTDAILP
jgi:TldD protein